MNNLPKMKPCPFCGGVSRLEHNVIQSDSLHLYFSGDSIDTFGISCTKCGVYLKQNKISPKAIIKRWNTRRKMIEVIYGE